MGEWKGRKETWLESPSETARALALWAWTGLKVMPQHWAPNFLARYLELPPIPHPTSTIRFGVLDSGIKEKESKPRVSHSYNLVLIIIMEACTQIQNQRGVHATHATKLPNGH